MVKKFACLFLFWIGCIALGIVVSILAQNIWISNGASEVDAMGVRGYIQGASVVLITWYFTHRPGSIEAQRGEDE